jgi:hypothetical protein
LLQEPFPVHGPKKRFAQYVRVPMVDWTPRHAGKGSANQIPGGLQMEIGIVGLLVVILLVVMIIYFVRRA